MLASVRYLTPDEEILVGMVNRDPEFLNTLPFEDTIKYEVAITSKELLNERDKQYNAYSEKLEAVTQQFLKAFKREVVIPSHLSESQLQQLNSFKEIKKYCKDSRESLTQYRRDDLDKKYWNELIAEIDAYLSIIESEYEPKISKPKFEFDEYEETRKIIAKYNFKNVPNFEEKDITEENDLKRRMMKKRFNF